MDIGSAIKRCRKNRKLSQKQLAEISDVSVSHLCLIEKSKREASLSTLECLSKGLQVPLSVLVLLAADNDELHSGEDIDLDKLTHLVEKPNLGAVCRLQLLIKKRPIGSISSLARALDVDQKTLVDVARNSARYWCPGKTIVVSNKDPRKTSNARKPLKSIHAKIKARILDHVEFPAYVMGGIASDEFNKRDYVCHAEMHTGKSILISEDIKRFYPNTTARTINDIWQGFFRFQPEVANILTLLTTYQGALPQGWIPSTHLANLALWRHEPEMVQALESLGFVYTRFVDDMTASSQEPVENEKKTEVVSSLIGLMRKCGFQPKRSKHSLVLAGDCMKVVNLNVDRKAPSMCKSERNRTRSFVHKCETYSPTARNCQEYIQIWKRASGRVSNLKRLHPEEAKLYRARLSLIRPQHPKRKKSKTIQVPVIASRF